MQPSYSSISARQEWLDKGLVFLFNGKTRCDIVTGLPLTLVGTNPSNTAVTAGTEGPNFTGTTNPAYFTAGGQNDYNITGDITGTGALVIPATIDSCRGIVENIWTCDLAGQRCNDRRIICNTHIPT